MSSKLSDKSIGDAWAQCDHWIATRALAAATKLGDLDRARLYLAHRQKRLTIRHLCRVASYQFPWLLDGRTGDRSPKGTAVHAGVRAGVLRWYATVDGRYIGDPQQRYAERAVVRPIGNDFGTIAEPLSATVRDRLRENV